VAGRNRRAATGTTEVNAARRYSYDNERVWFSQYLTFIQLNKAACFEEMVLGGWIANCGRPAWWQGCRCFGYPMRKYMTVGGVLGFAIGSFLDWQEKKRKRRRESGTGS